MTPVPYQGVNRILQLAGSYVLIPVPKASREAEGPPALVLTLLQTKSAMCFRSHTSSCLHPVYILFCDRVPGLQLLIMLYSLPSNLFYNPAKVSLEIRLLPRFCSRESSEGAFSDTNFSACAHVHVYTVYV